MTPGSTSENIRDRGAAHTKARGQFHLGETLLGTQAADLPHLRLGQFAQPARLASGHVGVVAPCLASCWVHTSFTDRVAHVVQCRPQKQVCGVYAWWVVAAVTDHQPIVDASTVGQNPRQAMRAARPIRALADCVDRANKKHAIIGIVACAIPNPARVRLPVGACCAKRLKSRSLIGSPLMSTSAIRFHGIAWVGGGTSYIGRPPRRLNRGGCGGSANSRACIIGQYVIIKIPLR